MELHEIHLPSVADYVAAFEATEARITPKQRECSWCTTMLKRA